MPQTMPLAQSRERAERVHLLRCCGYSWRNIANMCGFTSVGGAQRAYERHRKRNPIPDAETTFGEIIERRRVTTQAAMNALVSAQAAGDTSAVAALVRTVTALDAETSKLYGLHAPERLEVAVEESPRELIEAARLRTLESMTIEGEVLP